MPIRKIVVGFCIAAAAALAFALLLIFAAPLLIHEHKIPGKSVPPHGACASACSLVIEPDDGIALVRTMLGAARQSIDLVMYELNDKSIEADLAAAARRGVATRVLLSPGYEGEPSTINQSAFDYLSAHGVAVRWSPDYFALTHEKSFVIDGEQAFIMSFNWVKKYYPTGRDFGIIDRDTLDVAAMESSFNNDWAGSANAANAGSDLVWSPGSRAAITALISGATRSLDVYNEEMADEGIINALARATTRGVHVRIVMTYSPDWKTAFQKLVDAGVSIRTFGQNAPLYIHAKMILVDGVSAFVGSENFSATSLDKNRELGIVISAPDILASLEATFDGDWQGGTPFEP